MYDLMNFTMRDMAGYGAILRKLGSGTTAMEEVAQRIVSHLYDNLTESQTGKKSCVLARFYKTHPYGGLGPDLQAFARSISGHETEPPDMKCLTLLGSAGERPEWQTRAGSRGHKAIPLPSEAVIAQLPMVARLVQQFGLEVNTLLKPDPSMMVDMEQRTYNVFHVPDALGSPYIPAQEQFVVPYGVRSVLGFGGLLPSGDLFAIILFCNVPVSRDTADMFKTLALNVKMATLPFVNGPLFRS